MSERTSQVVRIGQLQGAKIKIKAVKNDGLHEYVTIVNRGTVTQPGYFPACVGRRSTHLPMS